MTNTQTSLQDKAFALKAEANRVHLEAAAEAETRDVSGRIDALNAQLDDVATLLATAEKLREAHDPPKLELPELAKAYLAFAKRAATGIPDQKDFSSARRALNSNSERMKSAITSAWAAWASARINEVRLLRIAMLPADEQDTQRERVAELRRLSRIKNPTAGDVTDFVAAMKAVSDALDRVDDPSDELMALIRRLSDRAVTLADITDDDIALLRASGLDDQIQLTRKAT